MVVYDIVIPYRGSHAVKRLYPIGDIHAGTIHCLEDDIMAKVGEIKRDKDAWWIGMGDYAEWITSRDPRFDPSNKTTASWVQQDNVSECQTNWIVDLFMPIKDKCIGLIYGNHENSIRVHSNVNVHKNICDRLGVVDLGYSCFVRMFFKRTGSGETHMVTGAFTHGKGGGATKGGKTNRLQRFMRDFEADIFGYAHMHDIIIDSRPHLAVSHKPFGDSKIVDKEAVGAVTGTWFSTYTQGNVASYGEMSAYPPTTIGCPVFDIKLDRNKDDITKVTFDVRRSR